jgi:hypothetical protein
MIETHEVSGRYSSIGTYLPQDHFGKMMQRRLHAAHARSGSGFQGKIPAEIEQRGENGKGDL